MVKALASIHNAGVIHQAINPFHILVNRKMLSIKYIDFAWATLLHRKSQIVLNFNKLEDALEWISPEQTGRMNKDVDFRTDFYSLGVVFYQMVCGVLPFTGSDSSKLIYAHIAKSPIAPLQHNPELSSTTSSIILKMMAKNPEDRYQSSHGVLMDLNACLEALQAKMLPNFPVGKFDVTSTFQLCQKLYGRENEIELLINSFEEVVSGSVSSNLVLVSGEL